MSVFVRSTLRLFTAFLVIVTAVAAAAQQPSSPGMADYRQAEAILLDYAKAGKPNTEAGHEQLKAAQVHLDNALKAEPENPFFWYVKAQALESLGKGRESLQAYQRSYAIRPQIQAAAGLGTIAMALGEYREATRVLSEAVVTAPSDRVKFTLMGKLALAYLLDGQHQQGKLVAQRLDQEDYSIYATALYVSASAIVDKGIDPPTDARDMHSIVMSFYELILEDDPILKSLDERKWALGFENFEKHQYVREYFLPGESPDHWTEMVTLQVLTQADSTPEKFMQVVKKITKEKCPDTKWKNIKIKKPKVPTVQVEWQTSGKCSQMQRQYETAKMLRLKEGTLARIAYVTRNKKVTKKHKRKWVKLITDSRLAHLGGMVL